MLGWGMYIGSRRELLWTLRHAGRARRGRAGAAGRPGPRHRAGPDRPRDARRARPPDLADLDARRRARLPRGPHRRARCAPAPRVIQEKAHEALDRPARRARRAARRRTGEPLDAPAADVRRPAAAGRRGARRRADVDFDDLLDGDGRRCRTRSAGRSTGSCRRASPTPASTRPARLLTVEVSGSPERRRRRAAAQPGRLRPSRDAGRRARPGRPGRAGRAARRPARAPPRGRRRSSCTAGYRGRHDVDRPVLVVDDDPLVRSALALMLGGQADLEVVGEAGDGRAGVRAGRASCAPTWC